MSVNSRFCVTIFLVSTLAFLALAQFKEGIGYIGPACSVVEGNLYIHGLLIRSLNSSEISQFETYQDELEKIKKSQPSSEPSSHPAIPSFCIDMSDSTEVVLKGCIVRDNRVFIKGKLVRPLNSLERETITKLLVARSPAYTPHTLLFERRKKRETTSTTAKPKTEEKEAINDVQNDVTNFLENVLKVNSTIAKRFLPVAKMSPLLNELSEDAVKVSQENNNNAHLNHDFHYSAADSIIPGTFNFDNTDNNNNNNNNDYYGNINTHQPAFAFAGEEQPFQHQLPQMHPLPNFEQPPFVSASDSDADSGDDLEHHFPLPSSSPSFHSFPSSHSSSHSSNFENAPAMMNNEQLTSAFLINGNGQPPLEIRGNIRPGDRLMMNGQSYVAVTMNQINPSQLGQLGNIFGNSQPQVIQQPNNFNTNYGSFVGGNNNAQTMVLPQMQQQQTQFWQPNNFNPYQNSNLFSTSFGQPQQQMPQTFSSQPKIRYHPGKSSSSSSESSSLPALSQADLNAGMSIINQMPHQICTAHIVNPFWFLEK